MRVPPFLMERWQSTFEHRVDCNISESGVHPLTLSELHRSGGRGPGDAQLLGPLRPGDRDGVSLQGLCASGSPPGLDHGASAYAPGTLEPEGLHDDHAGHPLGRRGAPRPERRCPPPGARQDSGDHPLARRPRRPVLIPGPGCRRDLLRPLRPRHQLHGTGGAAAGRKGRPPRAGDHFGMDRYLRIGFGNPAAELDEALDRVAALFEEAYAAVA